MIKNTATKSDQEDKNNENEINQNDNDNSKSQVVTYRDSMINAYIRSNS